METITKLRETSKPDVSLRALKERVRKATARSRTRLQEFFRAFDPHNHRRITVDQAVRALSTMGVELSVSEQGCLSKFLTGTGMFDYALFCDNMNKVFYERKHMERDPYAQPRNPLEGKPLHAYGVYDLTDDEREHLDEVLNAIRTDVANKGLLVKTFFKDFDRHNRGFVTAAQFEREIRAMFKFLTDEDVAVLAKAYTDGRDVMYRALHQDVTPDAARPEDAVKDGMWGTGTLMRYADKHERGSAKTAADFVEDKMVRQIATRRIRMQEFFTDFDKLRTGHCSREQFQRGIAMAKFAEISADEINAITARYFSTARMAVNYAAFCAEMNQAFTLSGLEKAPLRGLNSKARTIAKAPRRVRKDIGADPNLEAALEHVRTIVNQRRVYLKPAFQDYDRVKEEHVTRDQFLRVLRVLNVMPPTADQVQSLIAHYGSKRGDASVVRIDYRSFIEDVEPRFREESKSERKAAPKSEQKVDVDAVLYRIKRHCLTNSVRVEEFLRDFDPLRRDGISRYQLDTGLSNCQVTITPAELKALAETFVNHSFHDAAGAPYVSWRRFSDAVNAVFVGKHLEKDPEHDVEACASTALYLTDETLAAEDPRARIAGSARLTLDEEDDLRMLLSTLERQVNTRRINLIPAFQDFDRHRQGSTPVSQFARVLDRAGIPQGESELALLYKAFRVPKSDRKEINYMWFIEAIDNVDGVLGNLPGQTAKPVLKDVTRSRAARTLAETGRQISMPGSPTRHSTGGSGGSLPVDIEITIHRLQERMKTCGMRLQEFMADYDPLRRGCIPRAKLRTGLENAGMKLSVSELEALEKQFQDAKFPEYVRWRDLSHLVDGGAEGLERAPTMKRSGVTILKDVGEPLPDDVMPLLAFIKSTVANNRTNLKTFFQDYDRLRHHTVERSRFAAVLETAKIPLAPAQVRQLQIAFASSKDPKMVNYVRFVMAVDDSVAQ